MLSILSESRPLQGAVLSKRYFLFFVFIEFLNYKLAMSELLFLTQTRYCGLPFVWFLLRPLFLFGGV